LASGSAKRSRVAGGEEDQPGQVALPRWEPGPVTEHGGGEPVPAQDVHAPAVDVRGDPVERVQQLLDAWPQPLPQGHGGPFPMKLRPGKAKQMGVLVSIQAQGASDGVQHPG
jgi:hypothetical protein